MAKLVFPSVGKPYRGFVGEVRGWFKRIASWAENSPGGKAVVNTQIAALAAYTGYTQALPSTSVEVKSGVKFTAPAITGTYVNGYTATVVNGVITALVAS